MMGKEFKYRDRMHRRRFNFSRDLIGIVLAILVLLAIPYLFGEGWLFVSWIPALVVYGLFVGFRFD